MKYELPVARCAVIGLGKLGAPLAALLASKGLQTIGVDLNAEFVAKINQGKAPVYEPQLQEYLDLAGTNLQATTNCRSAILESNVTFIIVPTPSDSNGVFSNEYVLTAVEQVGKAIAQKADQTEYHLVVITSTVMPGSTGGVIKTRLEQNSGRKVGVKLGLCYNPEFIALGQVIQDMLEPDFILIGQSDAKAGALLKSIYQQVCAKPALFKQMNFINAELTKIAVNSFVTMKISYANMLSDLCDRLADADVDVVTDAVGMDSRIGNKYLKGRLGYAGPCFPRDNVAFSKAVQQAGARGDLLVATDSINNYQITRLYNLIQQHAAVGAWIGILGLTYKPNSVVLDASQAIALAQKLIASGYKVQAYDPLITEQIVMQTAWRATEEVSEKATGQILPAEKFDLKTSMQDCVTGTTVVVITTAYPEFAEIAKIAQAEMGKSTQKFPVCVIDCWRLLPPGKLAAYAKVIQLGKGELATIQTTLNEGELAIC